MTITELLRGRATLEQFDILQRADALRLPHVFVATSRSPHPHCQRCHVPEGSSESRWNGGTCQVWGVGRYYGGPLSTDELTALIPEKRPRA